MSIRRTLLVLLDRPPDDAPPGVIARITLHSGVVDAHPEPRLGLLSDPVSAQEREALAWYLEDYWKWPYEGFARRGLEVEQLLTDVGRRLYRAALEELGIDTTALDEIGIVSELPTVLGLPWELLHDGENFLAVRRSAPIAIVRRFVADGGAAATAAFEPPLRVLLVTARPEGTPYVDQRVIARELLEELEAQEDAGAVEIEFLRPPTLDALYERLQREPPVHVLHFDGHGVFRPGPGSPAGGQGLLAFEDDEGRAAFVEAEILAKVMRKRAVHLGILTACQSATLDRENAFGSVAAQFIRGGVNAVVAMSASVLVASAAKYTQAFYRAIAAGIAAPNAHERARQALHDDARRHVHQRRRDEEGTRVVLSDWWLPNLYVQRPVTLRAAAAGRRGAGSTALSAPHARLTGLTSSPPRYGFNGRAHELLWVERHLHCGRLVVLHGFGGVGKTALAREAADWLTRTGMYAAARFMSFEHGGDAMMLLSALGHQIGLYDGHFDPGDRAAALDRVRLAIRDVPTLIIIDNLEAILPAGEVPVSAPDRAVLYDLLLVLAGIPGCGMLLTTRDTGFGDPRLADGERVRHLSLGGLHPEDAYQLAARVLGSLSVPRERVPYPELRDLLAQLDHHPLAIQLVVPALRELSIMAVRAELAELLPRFADDEEVGRNRSLLASLDYSLRRLTTSERALLPRLAVFEGGAGETLVPTITEIPKAEWMDLRRALEEAGLIAAEPVHQTLPDPFLRFHPVLIPYLRSRYGAGETTLMLRYATSYLALANHIYYNRSTDPERLGALERRELPNLLRAFELFLEHRDPESATVLLDCVTAPLVSLGMGRILDQLCQRLLNLSSPRQEAQGTGELTQEDYLRETVLAEAELERKDIGAAHDRLSALLERMVALPVGAARSRGTMEHTQTLVLVARCLLASNQAAAAEVRLREAREATERLLAKEPGSRVYKHERGTLLIDIGDLHQHEGRSGEARAVYEAALDTFRQIADVAAQGAALTRLGTLALQQNEFAEAKGRFTEALPLLERAGNPSHQAAVWNMLGDVALKQQSWAEAEHWYRKSLALAERQADADGVAKSCTSLSIIASERGNGAEAEGWLKYALRFPGIPPLREAAARSNLARLLVNEVQQARAPAARLAEARGMVRRALALQERLGPSSEPWKSLNTLATIAAMRKRDTLAYQYRCGEREAYAAFAGNRAHIDGQFNDFIRTIVLAALDERAREVVRGSLPSSGGPGRDLTPRIERLWAGERDWHALADGLDRESALVVLRILEVLKQTERPEPEARRYAT